MTLHSRPTRAFSLLEMIVVVVILGVLAALALPSFLAAVNRAQNASTEATLSSLGRESQVLAAFRPSVVRFPDVADAAGDFPQIFGGSAPTWEATSGPSTRYGLVSVAETSSGVNLAVRSRSGACTMLSVGPSSISSVRTLVLDVCAASA